MCVFITPPYHLLLIPQKQRPNRALSSRFFSPAHFSPTFSSPLSLLNTTLDMEMDGKIQIKKLAMD
jgi:hypothetical protein